MDHDFLHVSEVGPVCDEIGVCADITPGPISRTDSQVHVKEFSEDPRTETAFQFGAVWGKKVI